ncbi:uncharacterized protein UTRI_06195 [Ustilago trichophora]|uniref:Effector family protein Eff1 n=1 Tax=Ustilago trichophora TaxID=86804 RepID=A0A5C3EI05_9BASI|nr:uncharacterized protein UTRI_06195 [Ustilago trichophora]
MLKLSILTSVFLLWVVSCYAARGPAQAGFGPSLPDSFGAAERADPVATRMERYLSFPSGSLQDARLFERQRHSGIFERRLRDPDARFFQVFNGGRSQVPIYASPIYIPRSRHYMPRIHLLFFKIEPREDKMTITPTLVTKVRQDLLEAHGMQPWEYLNAHATQTVEDLTRIFGPLYFR